MKRIIFIVVILVVISPAFIFEKTISGKVVDCATQQPIEGVEVRVNQRGWGVSRKQLLWDKDYIYKATTDSLGQFKIRYKVGTSAHLIAVKDGYLKAEQWDEAKANVIIGLLKGKKPLEVTTRCKLLSDCLKSHVEGNATVYKNVCH